LTHLGDALSTYRQTGNRHGEGAPTGQPRRAAATAGRPRGRGRPPEPAAAIFAELGDLRLEGYSLGDLGALDSLLGRHEEALAHLEQSLANCRATGDPGS
jgi:hypothetical protein